MARLREGQTLGIQGHRLASIYLLGYCGEMLLKAAYFRLLGWTLQQPILLADLQNARARALTLGCLWPGNLHYLPGWLALMAEERKHFGAPYAPLFQRSLNAHVTRLSLNWSETLRYYEIQPYRGELLTCLQAATWLIGQYRYL